MEDCSIDPFYELSFAGSRVAGRRLPACDELRQRGIVTDQN
jgi:hypothetical protein